MFNFFVYLFVFLFFLYLIYMPCASNIFWEAIFHIRLNYCFIPIRILHSCWDGGHASSSGKSSKRIGMCCLSRCSKKKRSSFLLPRTPPDLFSMLPTCIVILSSLQTKFLGDSTCKKPFGRKNDWTTCLKHFCWD